MMNLKQIFGESLDLHLTKKYSKDFSCGSLDLCPWIVAPNVTFDF